MKITFGKIVIDSPADSWEGAIRWIPIYADGKELHVYLQSQGVKTWEVSAEFWDDKGMPYDPEIELYYDVPLPQLKKSVRKLLKPVKTLELEREGE